MRATKTRLRKTRAQEFRKIPGEAQMHKNPLCAVSPELQLKYQDLGMTVTNWDRVR